MKSFDQFRTTVTVHEIDEAQGFSSFVGKTMGFARKVKNIATTGSLNKPADSIKNIASKAAAKIKPNVPATQMSKSGNQMRGVGASLRGNPEAKKKAIQARSVEANPTPKTPSAQSKPPADTSQTKALPPSGQTSASPKPATAQPGSQQSAIVKTKPQPTGIQVKDKGSAIEKRKAQPVGDFVRSVKRGVDAAKKKAPEIGKKIVDKAGEVERKISKAGKKVAAKAKKAGDEAKKQVDEFGKKEERADSDLTPKTGKPVGNRGTKQRQKMNKAVQKAAEKVIPSKRIRKGIGKAVRGAVDTTARVGSDSEVRNFLSKANAVRKKLPTADDYRTGNEGTGFGIGGRFKGKSFKQIGDALGAKGKKFEKSDVTKEKGLGKRTVQKVSRGRELDADGNPIEKKKDTSLKGRTADFIKRKFKIDDKKETPDEKQEKEKSKKPKVTAPDQEGGEVTQDDVDKAKAKAEQGYGASGKIGKDQEDTRAARSGGKIKDRSPTTRGGKKVTGGETDFSGVTDKGGTALGSNQKIFSKGGKKYVGRATDDPDRATQTTKRPAGSIQSRITGDLDRSDVVTDVDKSRKGEPSSSRRGKAVQLDATTQIRRKEKERQDKAMDSKKTDLDKREKFYTQQAEKGKVPKNRLDQEKKAIAKERSKLANLEKKGTDTDKILQRSQANREKKQLKLPAATGGRDLDPKALESGKKPPEKKKEDKVTTNTTPRKVGRPPKEPDKVTVNKTKTPKKETKKLPQGKETKVLPPAKDTPKAKRRSVRSKEFKNADGSFNKEKYDAAKGRVETKKGGGRPKSKTLEKGKPARDAKRKQAKDGAINTFSNKPLKGVNTKTMVRGKKGNPVANAPETNKQSETNTQITDKTDSELNKMRNRGERRAKRNDAKFTSGSFDVANTQGKFRKKEERKISKRMSKPKVTKESFSHWREEFIWETDKKYPDKVKEIKPMSGKNTITINPEDETAKYKRGY